jgi:hypothetical protein
VTSITAALRCENSRLNHPEGNEQFSSLPAWLIGALLPYRIRKEILGLASVVHSQTKVMPKSGKRQMSLKPRKLKSLMRVFSKADVPRDSQSCASQLISNKKSKNLAVTPMVVPEREQEDQILVRQEHPGECRHNPSERKEQDHPQK